MQLSEAGAARPGLVVIPAGVGSLAQAAITHYRSRRTQAQQRLLTVRARHCRLRPGQPGPRRAGHHLHQRDDHGRADLRHPFHAGLALPARWPGRGGRGRRCRQRHGGSGPGGLRDTGRPVRRGLAGWRPGRLTGEGAGERRASLAIRPGRDGGAAEHRRISRPTRYRRAPIGRDAPSAPRPDRSASRSGSATTSISVILPFTKVRLSAMESRPRGAKMTPTAPLTSASLANRARWLKASPWRARQRPPWPAAARPAAWPLRRPGA